MEPHPSADAFEELVFTAPDGLDLYARIYGAHLRETMPVVCLAGLTRNSRDFHGLAMHLSREAAHPRRVVTFDYRGRGRSGYARDWRSYDVATETQDVLAGLTVLGIDRAAFIGTSRGGLIIFALAAARPAAIGAVVLNDVGPVIEGLGLAQIRAFMENAPKPASFEEAATILRTAHGAAFTALDDGDWNRMARAIWRDEHGRPVADYDPKLSRTLKGIDFSRPLPVFWPQFQGLAKIAVLGIRGAGSTLLSAETFAEMGRRHPRFEGVTVDGQGHAPMLETAALPARIEMFLDRVAR